MAKLSLAEVMRGAVEDVAKVPKSGTSREFIEYIGIGGIREDEKNFYSLSGLDELAANIELVGLQQPLRVRADTKNGGYRIVSGHRRFSALRLLRERDPVKWAEVPCIVERDKASDAMQELRLIYANADTRRMTDAELARQVERVDALLRQLKAEGVELPGRLRDHVAEATHMSKTKVARLSATAKGLIPELKELWKDGAINTAKAERMARESAEVQRRMLNSRGGMEALTDGTEADVDEWCRGMARAVSGGGKPIMARAEPCEEPRPQWRTGNPPWKGKYYAQIQYEPGDTKTKVFVWDGDWEYLDGKKMKDVFPDAKIQKWYPLPE